MARETIVDAGPLAALLNRLERHHQWAASTWRYLTTPLITCEAVITETWFLLQALPDAADALLAQVESGVLRVEPLGADAKAIRALVRKYRSVPMSYADACLVRLTERYPDCTVVTLDSDFEIYRRNGRQVIPLKAPFK